MDQIWLASPSPAMRLWPGPRGATWRLNSAALAWARGLQLNETSWSAIANELSKAHASQAAREGRLVTVGMRWRSLPMSTGWLVWLIPDRAASEGTGAWGSVIDKLDLVQEFGRIGLFERDLKTGEGRWDAHMFRLFGIDPAQGMPTWQQALQRVHPDDRERFQAEHERFVREPGRHSVRYRIDLHDGAYRDMQTFAEVRLGADNLPALMIGVVFDDSEGVQRVRAQQAISEQFAKALRLAEIAVWRVDIESGRIQLNDFGAELVGTTPEHGISLDEMRKKTHPDDVAALVQASEEAMRTNAVVDVEARYPKLDGTGFHYMLTRRVVERDAQGKAIRLQGVSLDQTARIAERARAQALAQRIEMVANAAGVGIWSMDLATGDMDWNRQMFLIHGLPPDGEAPSFERYVGELMHPEDRAEFLRSRQRAIDTRQPRFDREIRILQPDGSVRWIEYRSRRDRHDGHDFIVGVELDATERVTQRTLAERTLREKEAAERASAEKSVFLARMSHEFRTPLNAVLGFAQLIEHEGAAAPIDVQLERVAHIRQAGEQLLALIGDVLDRVTLDGLADSAAAALVDESTPLTPAPATAQDWTPASDPKADVSVALSVLYIEDNPVNVILVEELVAMRANTTLLCAPDGLSGVALAAARPPDVVLVDMHLPDIDGFEVLRRLRKMPALDGSAIIALSANGMSEDIALARAAGFDDYWTKPIDFRRFLSGLDSLAATR